MADYSCYPLWIYEDGSDDLKDNPGPDELPLTADLKAALYRWADDYDRTLNHEYPPDSGFADPEAEEAFEAEGKHLLGELKAQLGTGWKVVYYSSRDSRYYE
jgi:hypothetical protein